MKNHSGVHNPDRTPDHAAHPDSPDSPDRAAAAAVPAAPVVVLRNVSKSFPSGTERLEILRDINLEIMPGQITVISGESGCGKSTLLNIIGGLDRPDEGEVLIDGQRIDTLNEVRMSRFRSRSFGFIFQFHYLLKDLNALENIKIAAQIAGKSRKEAVTDAVKLLGDVNLTDRKHHYPSQLSGGERQRIAVARALINAPLVLLADEPTGNLDERNSRQIELLLFLLARNHHKTLILVTHDNVLARRADVHYMLHHGSLSVEGR